MEYNYLYKNKTNENLNGLAPQWLVGVDIPQVDLFVLTACHKLFSCGVHVQSPQLICVTLSGKHQQTEQCAMKHNAIFLDY